MAYVVKFILSADIVAFVAKFISSADFVAFVAKFISSADFVAFVAKFISGAGCCVGQIVLFASILLYASPLSGCSLVMGIFKMSAAAYTPHMLKSVDGL